MKSPAIQCDVADRKYEPLKRILRQMSQQPDVICNDATGSLRNICNIHDKPDSGEPLKKHRRYGEAHEYKFFFVCFTTKDMRGADFQDLHRRVGGVSAGVPILTSVPVSVDQVWRKTTCRLVTADSSNV